MLPKKNRLTRKECDALFSQRVKIFHTPSLFVRAARAEEFRSAVAVSKKVLKRAVDRNQMRRVIYDGLRGYTKTPIHVMFSIKKGGGAASKEKIREEIKTLQAEIERAFLETSD